MSYSTDKEREDFWELIDEIKAFAEEKIKVFREKPRMFLDIDEWHQYKVIADIHICTNEVDIFNPFDEVFAYPLKKHGEFWDTDTRKGIKIF